MKKVKKSKAKEVKEVKNPKLKEATGKVKEATTALEAYFKSNKLDPTKDYSKDKKHGKAIAELVAKANINRDKVKEAAPKEEHSKKPRKSDKTMVKYDYPLVNGKEMTADEKKKYRQKMRSEAKGTEKAKAPKKEKKVEAESVATKKPKEADAKAPKKDKKKIKKSKKSED